MVVSKKLLQVRSFRKERGGFLMNQFFIWGMLYLSSVIAILTATLEHSLRTNYQKAHIFRNFSSCFISPLSLLQTSHSRDLLSCHTLLVLLSKLFALSPPEYQMNIGKIACCDLLQTAPYQHSFSRQLEAFSFIMVQV